LGGIFYINLFKTNILCAVYEPTEFLNDIYSEPVAIHLITTASHCDEHQNQSEEKEEIVLMPPLSTFQNQVAAC
jgi:hypothetical protein